MLRQFRIWGLLAHVSLWMAALGGINAIAAELHSVFTVQAPQGKWLVRALTSSANCPAIAWDQQNPVPMQVRAPQAVVPVRYDSAQANNKPAVFDITSCEAEWPSGVKSAKIEERSVPAPPELINRILIIADTGCRLKASDNAFQDCNDIEKWPFKKVAESASKKNPDLVVHIGDIHYRESPCPEGHSGCAGATWGYGWDAWRDDFFNPAKTLLASAPWLFVRGNHESCSRAGQGWFRFLDTLPWTTERNCNDPAHDMQGNFSEPFAVNLSNHTQFIVFDSSKSSGRAYQSQDPVFLKYQEQLEWVNQLATSKPESFFINHHPLLAAAAVSDPSKFKPGGSGGLQSVFSASEPQRLFPPSVSVTMHGHIHLFEAIGFKTDQPVSLVLGNSGSMNEGFAPTAMKSTDRVYKDAVVEAYASRSEYGFATLDRVEEASKESWLLTEYSTEGVAVIRCKISDGKMACN
jgi:Calcineurin-like phosphoesterase